MNPAEVELSQKKAELKRLLILVEEIESVFEEFNRSFLQFQHRYAREVGQKQAELERLNAQLEELSAHHASSYFRYGNNKGAGMARQEDKRVSSSFRDVKDVKKMYRKIASIIHPDKASEGTSCPLRTTLMAALNDAYLKKDIIAMQQILDQWKESPEAIVGDGINSEIERVHRQISKTNKRILDIEMEMSRVKASDMYALMLRVNEADKAGGDMLAEMKRTINLRIDEAKNTLLMRMYG